MLWFYENDLDRTVTQVLRQMLFRIRPGKPPGLQGNVLGLSVGGRHAHGRWGDDNRSIWSVDVHEGFFTRTALDANDAHPVIFELDRVVIRIGDDRVFSESHYRKR